MIPIMNLQDLRKSPLFQGLSDEELQKLMDMAEPVSLRAGEVLVLPSNLPHEAVALEESVVLDMFSPPREDWISRTDDYLRK